MQKRKADIKWTVYQNRWTLGGQVNIFQEKSQKIYIKHNFYYFFILFSNPKQETKHHTPSKMIKGT